MNRPVKTMVFPLILMLILSFLIVVPLSSGIYSGPTYLQYPANIVLTLEKLKPYPVQAALYPYINGQIDATMDLVIGKPTAILVDIKGKEDSFEDPLTLTFARATFDGQQPITRYKRQANPNGMLFFPYIPSGPEEQITIKLTDAKGIPISSTDVNTKITNDLYVTYAPLSNDKYGTTIADFQLMMESTNTMLEQTYPVKESNAYEGQVITGANRYTDYSDRASYSDPYSSFRKDCIAVNLQAAGKGGYSVGVAIAPAGNGMKGPDRVPDYFEYHGKSGAKGISFGPSTRGVIVLDGYYSAGAHEIGHTLELYWGVKEEYELVNKKDPGYRATGVCVPDNYIIDSWDIMGLGALRSPYYNWVETSTYVSLFNKLKASTSDPELIFVNGAIHKDGTAPIVTYDLPWYRLEGTPDTIESGNYSIQFISGEKIITETSFNAWFGLCLDPDFNETRGTAGFGYIETDVAAFSFTTAYPEGTTIIRIMNNTDPQHPRPLDTILASSLKVYPRADAGGPYEALVNAPVVFDAGGSTGEGLEYRWDFEGDGVFDTAWTGEPTATHVYGAEWGGLAALEVRDNYLTQRSLVEVDVYAVNPSPTIQKITAPLEPQPINEDVDVYAEFIDPIPSGSYIADMDWGDGSRSNGLVTFINGLGKISASHKYASPRICTVNISLQGSDGTSATGTYQYIETFDPSRGSVVGVGSYDSPVGAYENDPNLTGVVDFLFLVTNSDGASKPCGITGIFLDAGNLLFHSSSYNRLVVSGNKVTIRGTGSVNLKPGYEFLLTVTDGQHDGARGVDRIRIKIWETATSKVIYDSQMGAPDTADPSIITGGIMVFD